MTTTLERPRLRARVTGLAAAAVGLVLAGCTAVPSIPVAPAPSPSASASTAPAAATTCSDAKQSFTPLAQLPAPGQMPGGSYMATILRKGRLVAGVSADTRLFGARNPQNNDIEGFDIEILKQISTAIFGRPDRITFRVISAADRIPTLEKGTVDIVARNMTITCDRWKQIDFSSVYFQAGQKLLVPTSSAVTSITELRAGSRVCAPKGSTSIDRIKRDYSTLTPVEVDRHTQCLLLLQQGKVDAITGDDAILAGFKAQDPYVKVVGDPFSDEPYGLGISKEHPEFVQFVNAVLEKIKKDGTWTQLYDRWLKVSLVVAAVPPPGEYGRAQ